MYEPYRWKQINHWQSFDDVDAETFDVTYNYNALRNQKNHELLSPVCIELIDYYNEVSLFERDLKMYCFYLSLTQKAAEHLIADLEKENGIF